jgi:transposase
VLTGGERHESRMVPALLSRGAVRRPGPGRPRLRPRRGAGDKAFTGRPVRAFLRRRGIGAVIPTRKKERRRPGFNRDAYRRRNRVERLINRLKQFRRVATRYEKRAANYAAMLTIGHEPALALTFAGTP